MQVKIPRLCKKKREESVSRKTVGTRQVILDVSLGLFSEQGYAGTSIRQIARAVGVRESALYAHFSSKQEIMDTLCHTFGPLGSNRRVFERLATVEGADIRETLLQVSLEFVASWMDPSERKFARMMITEGTKRLQGADGGKFSDFMQEVRSVFCNYFKALIDKDMFVNSDAKFLGYEYFSFLHLIHMDFLLLSYDNVSIEELTELVRKHISFFCDAALKKS